MAQAQTEYEKIVILRDHFITLERNNDRDDLKPIYNSIISNINKAVSAVSPKEKKCTVPK